MTALTKLRELAFLVELGNADAPAQLAALATHLLPLAEALEEVLDEDSGDGIPMYAVEPARKALKALKEALA